MTKSNVIDLTSVTPKQIYRLPPAFGGSKPEGETLSFTNYFMEINNAPFFGISGEMHFSRAWEQRWEDSVLKMKAGGINTVSTYIFWIHHEEEEGVFDFSGRRNLRRFIEICGRHGLYVIVRIGPFNHGEVRNGGLPDWLYGKPFEVRGLDEGFLACVRRLYGRLAGEMKGLYYKDGGPVIAAQIENEYMHSAAPWEITTGVSNEWMTHGRDGDAYMLRLRNIAKEEGIDVPFYTCTGWGGASTPEEMMPLWGGYAYRPWIFYSHSGEHPATEEYIYRDNHNDAVPETYNFEPKYRPESKPYLCCEMGGGMTCCYNYRFRLPYESVDAMANIKLASGCNMLGYYMYHGGTNPQSSRGVYLNEGQVPKLSYDYQAAIGEFGQIRASFRRLRALHMLARSCESSLCISKTVLPEGSQNILPEDTDTLRYAVRITEQGRGYLFLNNFQDHAGMKPKQNETVTLRMSKEDIVFDNLSLAAGENCVLPFNLEIGGLDIRTAHAQFLTEIEVGGETYAFFFAPEGMTPRFTFPDGTSVTSETDNVIVSAGDIVSVECKPNLSDFTVTRNSKTVHIVMLTREQSLNFSIVELNGKQTAVITEGVILASGCGLKVEHIDNNLSILAFPKAEPTLKNAVADGTEGLFARYTLSRPQLKIAPELRQVADMRYVVDVPLSLAEEPAGVKDVILELDYYGDIGYAFIDGEMISDNFCNNTIWEIGLKEFSGRLSRHPLTVCITPFKEDSTVNVESVMAGRKEEVKATSGRLNGVTAKPVYEWDIV